MKFNAHAEALKFARDNNIPPHICPVKILEEAITHGAETVAGMVNRKLKAINITLNRQRNNNLKG